MSERFDRMKQVRLTPENLEKCQKSQAALKIKISIASIANRCFELGYSLFEKETDSLKKKGN